MTRPTLHQTYMENAEAWARRSTATRRQVGAVIVRDGTIAEGYNGTPPGWDNRCEDEHGVTLPHVVHAEQNALDKLTRKGIPAAGATLYVTLAPCIECAKRILGSGITSVYYRDSYRLTDGLDFLARSGIEVSQI